MKHLAVFLYAAASFAQSADLQYDAGSPQAAFAATEIRRAFAARGQSLVENGSGTQTIRLILTATADKANAPADSLGVARSKSATTQAYAIRRAQKAGVTTVPVLAADGARAMYGGREL